MNIRGGDRVFTGFSSPLYFGHGFITRMRFRIRGEIKMGQIRTEIQAFVT